MTAIFYRFSDASSFRRLCNTDISSFFYFVRFIYISLREEPNLTCKAAGKSVFASIIGLSFLFIVSTPPVDNFGKLPAPGAQAVLVARRYMAATRGSAKLTGQQHEILMPDGYTVLLSFLSD